MIDTTLLDSTEPISKEALQAFFQANDFSTMVSRYSKTIKEALDYGLDAVESNEEIAQQLLNEQG